MLHGLGLLDPGKETFEVGQLLGTGPLTLIVHSVWHVPPEVSRSHGSLCTRRFLENIHERDDRSFRSRSAHPPRKQQGAPRRAVLCYGDLAEGGPGVGLQDGCQAEVPNSARRRRPTHFQALLGSIDFQQFAGKVAQTIHGRVVEMVEALGEHYLPHRSAAAWYLCRAVEVLPPAG